jgi:TfoX/Sxy family transcriptional regulator of competence genes
MAYDEALAERLREALKGKNNLTEKKMFGGLAVLLNGNMSVGVNKSDLIVRVDAAAHDHLLKRKGARTFDLTGKPMKGWILVEGKALMTGKDLKEWVKLGIDYAGSLPKK